MASFVCVTEGNGFEAPNETLGCVAKAANTGKEVKERKGSVHWATVAANSSSVNTLVTTARTI